MLFVRVVECGGDVGCDSGETSHITLSWRRDIGRGTCGSNGRSLFSCPQGLESEPMDMSSLLESFKGPDRLVYSGGQDTGLDAGTNWRCFRSFGFERFHCPRKWLYISCRDSVEKEQSSLTQSKASVSRFQKKV